MIALTLNVSGDVVETHVDGCMYPQCDRGAAAKCVHCDAMMCFAHIRDKWHVIDEITQQSTRTSICIVCAQLERHTFGAPRLELPDRHFNVPETRC